MPEADLIELFVRPLERLQFRYLISGSVASMLYGEPRVTHDIDFVISVPARQLAQLTEIYPVSEYYVPPVEVMITEAARERGGQFNVIHSSSGFKADFFLVKRDEMYLWALRNARRYTLGEASISLAPPEYVIISKLEYFREGGSEKHLRDIRAMLRISGDQIDRAGLKEWIGRQKVEEQWQQVLKEL